MRFVIGKCLSILGISSVVNYYNVKMLIYWNCW